VFTVLKSKPALRFAKVVLVTVISVLLIIPILPAYATGSDSDSERDQWYVFVPESIPVTDDELDQMKALEEAYNSGIRNYDDIDFYFYLESSVGNPASDTTLVGRKHNSSSFYLYVGTMEVQNCNLTTYGHNRGTNKWDPLMYNYSAWVNYDTWYNSYGEYQIYNSVWETLGDYNITKHNLNYVEVKLVATSVSFFGGWNWWWDDARFFGCYSPDCWLYWPYPVLNP